jgi:hypothetical protein
MSIAELIMTGTERASKSTDWVADSLAKIGDNVTKVLVDRQQQKQAQEMLPMFQQGLKDAMFYANKGDAGLAYAKLMPFLTDPATARNPYISKPIENALTLIDASATQYARNIQVQAYKDRSSGGGGGDGGTPNPFAERFNQARGRGGIPSIDGLPTDTTGYNGMPAAYLNPQTEDDVISLFAPVPEGDSLPESGGVPAMQSGGGTSFGMRDSTTSFGAGAYQPSEETLQQFAEYSDQYDAAKPKQKKAIESQRTIVYDNKDALGRDIQNLDDDQFGFAQLEAGAADPTFVGIQFSRYKLGNVNAKGEQMYNPNTDADASIGRLQEAFNLVNDRPELKDIYTKAGGWKNIELKPITGKQDEDGVKTAPTFEVINKKNPNEKIEVTENEFSLLGTINKMIPTSQTNDMKIIRIGEEAKPTAEAPAETAPKSIAEQVRAQYGNKDQQQPTSGLPAAQPPKETSLEERLSQKTSAASVVPARTVTPEQQAQVAKSKAAGKTSALRSEKTKLERLIYEVSRASGKQSLKRGLSENDKDVIAAKKRIKEIDNELE